LPAVIDNGQYAATRAAAEHATYASAQTGITMSMVNNGGTPAGGITAIAFMAGAPPLAQIVAAMDGQGSLSGTLSGLAPLAATMVGYGSVVANLTTASGVTATIVGKGSLSGTMIGIAALEAALAGQGSVVADLIGQLIAPVSVVMAGRGSLVAFPTIPALRVYYPPFNPMGRQSPPYILKEFGVTPSRPAYLSTNQNGVQLFHQPSFVPNVNAGSVLPPRWSTPGTPNNQGFQGRVQAPGELLVAPDNLRLSGKVYTVVAEGMIFVPTSAVNPTFNLVMSQNYFGFGQAQVIDTLFTLVNPTTLTPGTMNGFTLIATLAGNGVGTPVVSCAGRLWIAGAEYYGSGYSINPPEIVSGHQRLSHHREPVIQLSLGVQFGGTVSGTDLFQAYLSKFEMSYNKGNF